MKKYLSYALVALGTLVFANKLRALPLLNKLPSL